MEIIYKDSDIVVCIKPKGILSAEDASGKPSMTALLKEELSANTVYPIHRLDREVSGIMVFALTKEAAARLSKDASDHNRFIKEYLAVVCGIPQETSGVFEDLLFKDSKLNKSYVVEKQRRGVKKAKLEYSVVKTIGEKAVVRIRLFTGRTHQIRVQFASRKMSLLGDRKYGGEPNDKGIALFSCKLSFYHPTTKKLLSFEKIPELSELI